MIGGAREGGLRPRRDGHERDREAPRVRDEVDRATDEAEASPFPEPLDCLTGIYADPPAERPLWFRDGILSAVERSERAEGWGTYNSTQVTRVEAKVAGGND